MEAYLLKLVAQNTPRRFSINDIYSLTSHLTNPIASGGSGNVYMGQHPDTTLPVAVKVLNENYKIWKDVFMAEVTTMYKLYHRNVVKFCGFCFEDTMKALVFEYMAEGSLHNVLHDKNKTIPWGKLYEIATDVANGLSYLHNDCPEQIIHYDVKPSNVLLDSDYSAKISDFGLAKLLNRKVTDHFTTGGTQGTRGYFAPETLVPYSPITCKCDVYSFGKMLFDILGTSRNNGLPCLQVWEEVENGRLDDIIRDCGIEAVDRQKARILTMVAFWCIQDKPEMRPSMRVVCNMLENEVMVTTPHNPFYLPMSSQGPIPSMQPLQ